MKVLVYEDSVEDAKVLTGFLKEFCKVRGIRLDVMVCERSYGIYYNLDSADLVFLDIEGMDKSGVSVGESIRFLNKEVVICFMTSHKEYVLEGYRARASRYFIKPLDKEVFFREMNEVLKDYLEKYEGFVDKSMYPKKIYYKDIVYVQYDKRKVIFYMCDGRKLVSLEPLKVWKERLSGYWIVQCYKSYLVNVKYMKSYDAWNVYFSDKLYVPMSRMYRKEVEELYYELVRRSL